MKRKQKTINLNPRKQNLIEINKKARLEKIKIKIEGTKIREEKMDNQIIKLINKEIIEMENKMILEEIIKDKIKIPRNNNFKIKNSKIDSTEIEIREIIQITNK